MLHSDGNLRYGYSNTLYPKLEDHPLVEHYPHIRGMHRDVFFMTHNHKESGAEEDAISKYNQFEVGEMIYPFSLQTQTP